MMVCQSSKRWYSILSLLKLTICLAYSSVVFASYAEYKSVDDTDGGFSVDSVHHRTKREVIIDADVPRPTTEYPLVLFSGLHFNNNSADTRYERYMEDQFVVWGRTVQNQQREFVFRSMLFMNNRNITFKACCLGGNKWYSQVTDITNISDIHLWMFDNPSVGGYTGIWYTEWPNWIQEFAVRVDKCDAAGDCTSQNCSKTCYFGTCGVDGNCQCASGYSGDQCQTRPSNPTVYPSQKYPLLLFPETNFRGTPKKIAPDTFGYFAKNDQNERKMDYKSFRIYPARKITFLHKDESSSTEKEVPVGTDIEDIQGYMTMNEDIANPLWYNYERSIDMEFAVKVEDVPACTNCSETGGSCFTKSCVCLPGYSGSHCETGP